DEDVLKKLANMDEKMHAAELADLAVALSNVVRPADYTTANGVMGNLPYGYYLVIETENKANDGSVRSKPILVSVPDRISGLPDVSVTVKTSSATVEKDIVLGSKTAKTAEKKIGDFVDFKLTAEVPTYTANATGITYFLKDTLSKGLDFDDKTLSVSTSQGTVIATNNYTVSINPVETGTELKINFVYNNIKDAGSLIITYSAKLNEKAIIGSSGNQNSVTLTYSNNPSTESTYTTPPKRTIVYTTGIKLTKLDSKNSNKLAGATFGIFSDAACKNSVGFYTYVMTTDETGTHITPTLIQSDASGMVVTGDDGIAYFTGLIAGDYYIKEIKAPVGYDLLKEIIHLTISVKLPDSVVQGNETAIWTSDNSQFTNIDGVFHMNVINNKGFQLPGTGGMGTTIFTLGGIGLVVLSGVLFFVYYKKKHA
ncbi:MAG: SpaH/EbpB family LPXTG-anchored major pilin, partial [Oscillospiraceae bacterium]